jgi:dihydroorotase
MTKAGFWPDTISTDLHASSMNAGVKDVLNVMSKFLAMGMPLDKVIAANTWNAAKAIKQEQLGNLSVGSIADVAVLRVEKGNFGFVDSNGARMKGMQKLVAEITLRDGKVVWDLNGMTRDDWGSGSGNSESQLGVPTRSPNSESQLGVLTRSPNSES